MSDAPQASSHNYSVSKLNVTQQELEIVQSILKQQLPENMRVLAYGSRVTSKAKRFSDLDLAIQLNDKQALTLSQLAALSDAFDESELPWKIDILDLNSAPEASVETVERDGIEISLEHYSAADPS
ncbi:MAG: nucleotidyltransferase domain-containing protein [Oceanobacter sp.]